MKTASYLYKENELKHSAVQGDFQEEQASLVLCFGSKHLLSGNKTLDMLRNQFPHAQVALCSTAGEIYGTEVLDDSLSVTAVKFEKTSMKTSQINHAGYTSSFDAGAALVQHLPEENLKYILVLADGSLVNGSELVRGIESKVKHNVPVTGGLAGDGTRFESTLVGLNSTPEHGNIIALGFYGDALRIGHGSMGGWDIFGMERDITHSQANELFEINGSNALELYKQYLGKYADDLPGSALLFPLSVQLPGTVEPVVRTILSINNERQSMIFAGDVPVGAKVRFMKANFDNLVDAAGRAAQQTFSEAIPARPKLALLISCVGRKIILDSRADEEVEAVADMFGPDVALTGFYSYGEISPLNPSTACQLHNQTMTITTFDEI